MTLRNTDKAKNFTRVVFCTKQLYEALSITISEQTHPELAVYRHQDILFSDGTCVLGADDKATTAVMMLLAKALAESDNSHGNIYLAFVPGEEIGLRGAKVLPLG